MEVPIQTLHLFSKLDKKLIEVLKTLDRDDWHRPTRAKLWTVKDVATHLLDTNLRTLSVFRDKYQGDPPQAVHSYDDLVAYLNRLNADWVTATKRISPEVLTFLLEITGPLFCEYLKTLDPFGESAYAVSWAGESKSFNWFHIAREYTEKWHHQQQIREAVGKHGIETAELYYPVLETFIQALPYHYRNVQGSAGDVLKVTIEGEAGGHWFIQKEQEQWKFVPETKHDASVRLSQDTAWKLFTKGLSGSDAEGLIRWEGNKSLAIPFYSIISVMA